MKRFKVSLAILALILAVGSAFTTKSSVFANEWFPNTPQTNPPTYAQTSDLDFVASEDCDPSTTIICAGLFAADANHQRTGSVISTVAGLYDPQ